jgi:MFS family permease
VFSIVLKPNVLASIVVGILLLFAASSSMTIWGVWLSADFGLTAAALGLVATSISIAELGGIVLSALIIDRVGKRRGSQIGLLSTAAVFMALPLMRFALFPAIATLVVLGGVLEFTTISLFSLFSEQLPQARAMMFSLVGLGMALGMGLGPPVTVALWEQVGLWAVGTISSISLLLTFYLVWRELKEAPGSGLAAGQGSM